MKITFKSDYTPPGQAADRPTYKAGKTYEFSDPVGKTYAEKYVNKGLAEPFVEPEKPAPVAEPEPVVEESSEPAQAEDEGTSIFRRGRRGR